LTVERSFALTLKGSSLAKNTRASFLERLVDRIRLTKPNLVSSFDRIKPREFVFRKLEQPHKVRAYMESKSVQFFLRDVDRLEMTVDEEVVLEKFFERAKQDENIVLSLRKMRYEKPRFIEEFNIITVLKLRQTLRRVLFQERWERRFGREIKEKIQGPLYRYEPKDEE